MILNIFYLLIILSQFIIVGQLRKDSDLNLITEAQECVKFLKLVNLLLKWKNLIQLIILNFSFLPKPITKLIDQVLNMKNYF